MTDSTLQTAYVYSARVVVNCDRVTRISNNNNNNNLIGPNSQDRRARHVDDFTERTDELSWLIAEQRLDVPCLLFCYHSTEFSEVTGK